MIFGKDRISRTLFLKKKKGGLFYGLFAFMLDENWIKI
jgi:hypothetical protein